MKKTVAFVRCFLHLTPFGACAKNRPRRFFAVAGAMLAVAGLAQAAGRSGEEIYTKTCKVCHEAGIAGSPKFGDKAAWEPRIAKGMDALMASAVPGTAKGMPPKGTCMDCDDAELKAAIEFMVSKAKQG